MNKYVVPLLLIVLAAGFGAGYGVAELTKANALDQTLEVKDELGVSKNASHGDETVSVPRNELKKLQNAQQELGRLEESMARNGNGAEALQDTIKELREQVAAREREVVSLNEEVARLKDAGGDAGVQTGVAGDFKLMNEKYKVLAPIMLKAYEEYKKLEPEKRTPDAFFKVFSDMQKDHDTQFMEWLLAFIALVNKTRAESPRLFFDEKFLPDVLVSLFEVPVELDSVQVEKVRALGLELARKHAADLDTSTTMANVMYKARWDLSNELGQRLDLILSDAQYEKYEALAMLFGFLFRGSQTTYGLGVMNAQQGEAKIVEKYTEVYGLDETQQNSLRAILAGNHAPEKFVEVMVKYDLFNENSGSRWSQNVDKFDGLDYELVAIQVELIDKPLKSVLTAEQIGRVDTPQLIQLVYGEDNGVINNNNMGY